MIILEYLNYLFNYLQDGSLPWEVRVAIGLFIMCTVLLLSIINIINYFLIFIFFENKRVQEWMNKYKIIKYIFTKYKATRVYFLILEISLSLYIILFILYICFQVFYTYLST